MTLYVTECKIPPCNCTECIADNAPSEAEAAANPLASEPLAPEDVARRDPLVGLLRMQLLPRCRYLLDVAKARMTLDFTVQDLQS